jgi:sensor histidine kinase YesM
LNTPSTSWSSRLSSARLTREEQEKLSEAERKALESQMNPHFCSIR